MSFFSRFTQNVIFSTLNSSTSNLDAGATFTGVSESTLGIVGIQVMLYADQNCTVYIDQSNDGINWDIIDNYNYHTNQANKFGVTTQAIGSYFRVRVTNESTTLATTQFRLGTALCPIVEAVPRTLSEEGNLKVGVYEIENEQGNKVVISPNGALETCKVIRLIGTTFTGTTIDTRFWASTTAAGGTGVQTGGQFEMRTNTTPNGASALQSVRTARYVNGVPNFFRAQIDWGNIDANNTKRVGCFTGTAGSPTNGAAFEIINEVLSVATYKAGTPTRVVNGDFNGDWGANIEAADDMGCETHEIIFNNRYVYFMYNGKLLHKVDAIASTWTDTLSLPCRAENYNTSGGTIDTSLKLRSFVVLRYGELQSQLTSYFHANGQTAGVQLKIGGGNLHSLIMQALNNSVITLSDSTTAATPVIYATTGVAAITQPVHVDLKGLPFYDGLRLTVSGANAQCTIIYE